VFPSSTDVSNDLIGLNCSRLETPLPGFTSGSWAEMWRLFRLLEGDL